MNNAPVADLQAALNACSVELTAAVRERQRFERVNRQLNQRIIVLEKTNRFQEANYEEIREQLQRATAALLLGYVGTRKCKVLTWGCS